MDNLTHSLLGAALAEVALPPGAPRPARRLFYVAAVAAANLPDLDLVYTGVTPAPLGYLLHHRGHTHTLVGLVAQAVPFGLLCRVVGPGRRLASDRVRLWILIAAGLAQPRPARRREPLDRLAAFSGSSTGGPRPVLRNWGSSSLPRR